MGSGKPYQRSEESAEALARLATGETSLRAALPKDPPRRPDEQKAATYRIGHDLIERINEASETLGVEKTSFIKALLTHALDELDAENWELPPAGKRKLKI